MNSTQLETALNTESPVTATAIAVPVVETATQSEDSVVETPTTKRVYTSKEDMQRGNDAILATLPTEGDGFNKAAILNALSTEDRALVERNWNLRIALLEETQQVRTEGKKVAKRYWRAV
jgi:hypothetical protein